MVCIFTFLYISLVVGPTTIFSKNPLQYLLPWPEQGFGPEVNHHYCIASWAVGAINKSDFPLHASRN